MSLIRSLSCLSIIRRHYLVLTGALSESIYSIIGIFHRSFQFMLSSFPCIDDSVTNICLNVRSFADGTSLSFLVDNHHACFGYLTLTKNQNIQIKIVSMIRKYHNSKLQTNAWHRDEEPHKNHETPGRQTKQSNQLYLPHRDDCLKEKLYLLVTITPFQMNVTKKIIDCISCPLLWIVNTDFPYTLRTKRIITLKSLTK